MRGKLNERPTGGRARADYAVAILVFSLIALCGGCATHCVQRYDRPFSFERDTFAYRNDLVWEYVFDDVTGKTSHRARYPKPNYTHHCFVVARSARQFFQHARFAPELPRVTDTEYRKLIREVVRRDPSRCTAERDRVVLPGFAGLREFSTAKPELLQDECGGAWRSYFQRGHWKMVAGITRGHQEREVAKLIKSIRDNRPPVVHVVSFPRLTINHALLLYDVEETLQQVHFTTYDPYETTKPVLLTYERTTRAFSFPRNPYFRGGSVDVYEIYKSAFY